MRVNKYFVCDSIFNTRGSAPSSLNTVFVTQEGQHQAAEIQYLQQVLFLLGIQGFIETFGVDSYSDLIDRRF